MLDQGISNSSSYPGLTLKAWAQVSASGVLIKSFNIASNTHASTGNYAFVFTTNMASANYIAKVRIASQMSMYDCMENVKAVGSCSLFMIARTAFGAGVTADSDFFVEFLE